MGKDFGIPQKECLKFKVGLECIAIIRGEPDENQELHDLISLN
jgi:hypothetical protein